MGLFGFGNKKKLDSGLSKTRTGFFGNIVNTLIGSQITDDLYDELEEQLILWSWWKACARKCRAAISPRANRHWLH